MVEQRPTKADRETWPIFHWAGGKFKILLKLMVKHVFLWPAVAIVKGILWPGQCARQQETF